jgi:hypothetical protein
MPFTMTYKPANVFTSDGNSNVRGLYVSSIANKVVDLTGLVDYAEFGKAIVEFDERNDIF